ncbi:hypothetical protein EYF80_052591 [Liparis tanakae]|uniref:Uncharacterized protein n=1 Tax=Liparis tanakae TaxID=230148 RepID=A0A4Z2F7W1_9TELE|nr:hypothetical protein EYF80_052591 [Liparis tanakae]
MASWEHREHNTIKSAEVSAPYCAVVVAAAPWEKEAEPWETTGATGLPYIPGPPGCPPWTFPPAEPEATAEETRTTPGITLARFRYGLEGRRTSLGGSPSREP